VKRPEKRFTPLPYGTYYTVVLVLALLGLAVSAYLSVSHYRIHTDMAYSSFCAVSRAVNCDTVSQSPYAIFLGVPVPVWGVWGYAFFTAMLLQTRPAVRRRRRMWALLTLTAAGFSAYSMVLAVISTFFIRSYCVLCILTYVINRSLLFYAWLVRRRFDDEGFFRALSKDIAFLKERKKAAATALLPFLLAAAAGIIFFPPYWHFTPPPLSADVSRGVTPDGHPWIGAADPEMVIVEFADYQCFQCRKVHFYLRHIIDDYPDRIRLVHRHFPMDHKVNPIVREPLHVRAGALAMLGIFAQEKGRFWRMNDLLFDIAREPRGIDLQEIADWTGIDRGELEAALKDRKIWNRLIREIRDALKAGVTGTPAFLIDGQLYTGQLPRDIFKRITE